MEESNTLVEELLKQFQREYTAMGEVFRLTEELARVTSSNDQVSAQLVLDMRQEELEKIVKCRDDRALLEDAMKVGQRQAYLRMLEGEPEFAAETFAEKKILQIRDQIRTLLEKTRQLDRNVNRKIAGKDSFYEER